MQAAIKDDRRSDHDCPPVECFEAGEGPPVVLIHGLGGARAFWDDHVAWLARDHRVITLDYPDVRGEDFIGSVAAGLYRSLRRIGVDRAVVIGHSLGSLVAQSLALSPDNVASGLVLSASFGASEGYVGNLMQTRRALLELGGLDAHRAVSRALLYTKAADRERAERGAVAGKTHGLQEGIGALLSKMDAVLLYDRRHDLAKLTIPVSIVCARDDLITPVEYARELARIIPNAVLHEIEGGGHYVPLSRTAEYRAILERCLAEIERVR